MLAGRLMTAYQALRRTDASAATPSCATRKANWSYAAKVKPDTALSLEFLDGKVQVATPNKQGKLL